MKKKIFSFILSLCLFVPAIFLLTACNSKKDITAPTLDDIYQELSNGCVYVSYSNLTTPTQAPQYSFDNGETWITEVTKTSEAEILILTYDGDAREFYVPSNPNISFDVGVEINVVIREGETKDYKISPKSNNKTITIKKPAGSLNFATEQRVAGGVINHDEFVYSQNVLQSKLTVCYDETNDKYAFGTITYDNIADSTTPGYTTYTEYISLLSTYNQYEYINISAEDFTKNQLIIENEYKNKTFTSCSQYFEDLVFCNTEYTRKEAKIIVRSKETANTLSSQWCFITIGENIITYTPTSNNITNVNITSPVSNNFNFQISNNQTLNLNNLKSIFTISKWANYSNTFGIQYITNFDCIIKNANNETVTQITQADDGSAFSVEIKNGNKLLLTLTINIEYV